MTTEKEEVVSDMLERLEEMEREIRSLQREVEELT